MQISNHYGLAYRLMSDMSAAHAGRVGAWVQVDDERVSLWWAPFPFSLAWPRERVHSGRHARDPSGHYSAKLMHGRCALCRCCGLVMRLASCTSARYGAMEGQRSACESQSFCHKVEAENSKKMFSQMMANGCYCGGVCIQLIRIRIAENSIFIIWNRTH